MGEWHEHKTPIFRAPHGMFQLDLPVKEVQIHRFHRFPLHLPALSKDVRCKRNRWSLDTDPCRKEKRRINGTYYSTFVYVHHSLDTHSKLNLILFADIQFCFYCLTLISISSDSSSFSSPVSVISILFNAVAISCRVASSYTPWSASITAKTAWFGGIGFCECPKPEEY